MKAPAVKTPDVHGEIGAIDPHTLVHFVVACQVAGFSMAGQDSDELRALIQQLSYLSIPDAVTILRRESPCK